ncbi:HAD-IA family hydrolase [Candidatus Dependentiae bacterium]|nr:HAD-IA family hydrolase [Candidatus Dependentiae bacterium]
MITTHPSSLLHKTYNTIILDLGSVLVDVDPNTLATLLGNHIYTLTPETCRAMFTSIPIKKNAAGIINDEQALAELYAYFPKNQVDLFKKLPLFQALQPLPNGLKLFNLARQRAKYVYILTNITPISFEHVRQTTPFINEANGYITSFDAKSRKPDPAIYQALIKDYTITPQTALFFDDLQDNCKAASALGIDSVVCNYDEDIVGFFAGLKISNIG